MRIAISGIGTSVGLGVIKSIKEDSQKHFILGLDNVESAHSFMVDKFEYMEKVELLENCEFLVKKINHYKIDVVLIASEYEIEWFSRNKSYIEFNTQSKVLVAPKKWVDIGNDKLKTYSFLNKIGLSVAPFFYFDFDNGLWISGINSQELQEIDFPIFLKPKFGTSNKGIISFKDFSEFQNYNFEQSKNMFVLQKSLLVKEDSFEVTSSIVLSKEGKIVSNPFHAKRILNKGISWTIEKYDSKKLDQIVLIIAKNMKGYIGSLNIQFMGSEDKGFYPLEINTRFSGTTSFRTKCGLNEVMYLTYDLVDIKNNDLIDFKTKRFPKMFRYVEDYIIHQ